MSTTNPGTCDDTFGTRVPTVGSVDAGRRDQHDHVQPADQRPRREHDLLLLRDRLELARHVVRHGGLVHDLRQADGDHVAGVVGRDHRGVVNGSANPNGASATGWFRFSTTDPGSCNDTFGTRVPSSGGVSLGAGRTAVSYIALTSNTIALLPGTTYYFCAIASNASARRSARC